MTDIESPIPKEIPESNSEDNTAPGSFNGVTEELGATFKNFFSTGVIPEGKDRLSWIELAKREVAKVTTTAMNITDQFRKFFSGNNTKTELEKNPFDAFSPEAYISLFYPELTADGELLQTILTMFANNEQTITSGNTNRTILDMKVMQDYVASQSQEQEGISEALENYAIYDFMVRRATKRMLEYRPEDHFSVLDVGGGPTIYQHLAMLPVAENITHAEYSSENRAYVEAWRNKKTTHDWSSYVRTVVEMLRKDPDIYATADPAVQQKIKQLMQMSPEETEHLLREKMVDVLPVNVFTEDLGLTNGEETYDLVNMSKLGSVELVTSNFCVESATPDEQTWKEGIKNVTSRISSDGFLQMTAIRNATWYAVGEERMPAYPVDADKLISELEAQGLEILETHEILGSDVDEVGYDGMIFVLARRTV